jgi:hypothetical protein
MKRIKQNLGTTVLMFAFMGCGYGTDLVSGEGWSPPAQDRKLISWEESASEESLSHESELSYSSVEYDSTKEKKISFSDVKVLKNQFEDLEKKLEVLPDSSEPDQNKRILQNDRDMTLYPYAIGYARQYSVLREYSIGDDYRHCFLGFFLMNMEIMGIQVKDHEEETKKIIKAADQTCNKFMSIKTVQDFIDERYNAPLFVEINKVDTGTPIVDSLLRGDRANELDQLYRLSAIRFIKLNVRAWWNEDALRFVGFFITNLNMIKVPLEDIKKESRNLIKLCEKNSPFVTINLPSCLSTVYQFLRKHSKHNAPDISNSILEDGKGYLSDYLEKIKAKNMQPTREGAKHYIKAFLPSLEDSEITEIMNLTNVF